MICLQNKTKKQLNDAHKKSISNMIETSAKWQRTPGG